MRQYAVYGKGGIGKSTLTSNISAAVAGMGYRVMQIGCDPKADSCYTLLHGQPPASVMDYMRAHDDQPALADIVRQGFAGVYCVETGGPAPGVGCAGRGILTTFQVLEELDAFGQIQPDFVFYDVLGDVVCGGFSAPIRPGRADEVIVITSGERMALYAAENILAAVKNFKERGYASVRGLVLNRRDVEDEGALVAAFAARNEAPILGDVPRAAAIQQCENRGLCLMEGAPGAPAADVVRRIAQSLVEGAAYEN
jgi:nitrogenase iron protein NifH